ncbi:hypothetical protein Agub_g2372, partial [Astrephomene gubernaculifera]
ARVLTSAGRAKEALDLYGKLLAQRSVRQDDSPARLSYAMALQQAGRSSEALPLLSELATTPAAPTKLRLAAATAAVRALVAVRRWDEAYGLVLTVTADLPEEAA